MPIFNIDRKFSKARIAVNGAELTFAGGELEVDEATAEGVRAFIERTPHLGITEVIEDQGTDADDETDDSDADGDSDDADDSTDDSSEQDSDAQDATDPAATDGADEPSDSDDTAE